MTQPVPGTPIRFVPTEEIERRRRDNGWLSLLLRAGEVAKIEDEWWFCCPCGAEGSLDHEVTMKDQLVTIHPSVICPRGCHYWVKEGVVV